MTAAKTAEAAPESPVEAAPVVPQPTREELIQAMNAEIAAFEADKRKLYTLIRTLRGTYGMGGSASARLLTTADMEGASTTPMLRGAALTTAVAVKGYDTELYSERGLVVKLEELRARHQKVLKDVRIAACSHASAGYMNKEQLDEVFKTAGMEPVTLSSRLEISRNSWVLITPRVYNGSHSEASQDFKERFEKFLKDNDYTVPGDVHNLSDIYVSQTYA